jgi:two-component system phosphate regulon sensor histidine kinase PhoR
MKTETKHKRILILMVTSQLLLTGFVIQWLLSQYNEEKTLLVKELNALYVNSQDEVLDTLLLYKYIDPVLSENRIIMMDHRVIKPDSSTRNTLKISKFVDVKKLPEKDSAIVTVRIMQGGDSSVKTGHLSKKQLLPDDMLLKSIKLIIAHSKDTGNIENLRNPGLLSSIDSTKFKKYFQNRIAGAGINLQIAWKNNVTDNSINKQRHAIVIKPFTGFLLPVALISGFRGYLVGRMTTQIIFGLVLVLITALAFIISDRSLRNHAIMDNLRNEFINNITHELKTPVSTIMVALESLGSFNVLEDPEMTKEYLRLASIETKRLGELIDRVLDQSLLEQNEHPLEMSNIDLNILIPEVVQIMRQKIGRKGKIEFSTANTDLKISGDRLYLTGVLINLIDNAIKYSDQEPVIKVLATRTSKEIRVEINDNGPGIPEEYQKRIFDKFFRVPNENIHNVKGYGLGLSFASLVMELHKGSIEVRNLNPGCSFILKFPVS